MGNLVWAIAIAGGAALLGAAIAFGMVKDHPRRTTSALVGAAVVVIAAIGLSFIVSGVPNTAPSDTPDSSGSQYSTPALPSDQNALLGLSQPGPGVRRAVSTQALRRGCHSDRYPRMLGNAPLA